MATKSRLAKVTINGASVVVDLLAKPTPTFNSAATEPFTTQTASAWPTTWTTQVNGGTATVVGGKGTLATAASNYNSGTLALRTDVAVMNDAEAYGTLTYTGAGQLISLVHGAQNDSGLGIWSNGGGFGMFKNGYTLQLDPTAGTWTIDYGYTAGSHLASGTFTPPTNFIMGFRYRVYGTTIAFKLWNPGSASTASTEPAAWTYSGAIRASQYSGLFGLATTGNTNNTTVYKVALSNDFVLSTPTVTLGPSTRAPVGDVGVFKQEIIENFDTAAAAATTSGGTSPFATTYQNSWVPYADGTGGIYYSGTQISAHDGVMDVLLDGAHGAAGSFGSPAKFNTYIGGRFSMRACVIGGIGNGMAAMLWPTSEVWADGEVDFPESNFEATPEMHVHVMNGANGDESASEDYDSGLSWRPWHVYDIEWYPPNYFSVGDPGLLNFYIDGTQVYSTTKSVPSTAHRHMWQLGAGGGTGHAYFDWFTHYRLGTQGS